MGWIWMAWVSRWWRTQLRPRDLWLGSYWWSAAKIRTPAGLDNILSLIVIVIVIQAFVTGGYTTWNLEILLWPCGSGWTCDPGYITDHPDPWFYIGSGFSLLTIQPPHGRTVSNWCLLLVATTDTVAIITTDVESSDLHTGTAALSYTIYTYLLLFNGLLYSSYTELCLILRMCDVLMWYECLDCDLLLFLLSPVLLNSCNYQRTSARTTNAIYTMTFMNASLFREYWWSAKTNLTCLKFGSWRTTEAVFYPLTDAICGWARYLPHRVCITVSYPMREVLFGGGEPSLAVAGGSMESSLLLNLLPLSSGSFPEQTLANLWWEHIT